MDRACKIFMALTVAFTLVASGCQKKPSAEERITEAREHLELQLPDPAAVTFGPDDPRTTHVELTRRLIRVLNDSDKTSLRTPVLVSPGLFYNEKEKRYIMLISWVEDVPSADGFEIRSHGSSEIRLRFSAREIEANRNASRNGSVFFEGRFSFEKDGKEWGQLGTPEYGIKLECRLLQGKKPVTKYVELLWAPPIRDPGEKRGRNK